MSNLAKNNGQQPTPMEQGALEQVLAYGDLTKLSASQRTAYYMRVCESLGLNPISRPFEFINLSGKLVFYARRDCTDQLRRVHTVSVRIVGRERIEDVYIVTSQATLPSGRTDESTGAVNLANLKGENLANALMKAETKAKRRVTLSICGLSVLDESELDTIKDAKPFSDLPKIGPTSEPTEAGEIVGDEDVFQGFARRLDTLDADIQRLDNYDSALAAAAIIGSPGKQSVLSREMQQAYEKGELSGEMRSALGKKWQRCYRQVTIKLEKLKTDAASSFVDDPADEFDRT
jgi:hypothetical protein